MCQWVFKRRAFLAFRRNTKLRGEQIKGGLHHLENHPSKLGSKSALCLRTNFFLVFRTASRGIHLKALRSSAVSSLNNMCSAWISSSSMCSSSWTRRHFKNLAFIYKFSGVKIIELCLYM